MNQVVDGKAGNGFGMVLNKGIHLFPELLRAREIIWPRQLTILNINFFVSDSRDIVCRHVKGEKIKV